jgi:hypothetical protein
VYVLESPCTVRLIDSVIGRSPLYGVDVPLPASDVTDLTDPSPPMVARSVFEVTPSAAHAMLGSINVAAAGRARMVSRDARFMVISLSF